MPEQDEAGRIRAAEGRARGEARIEGRLDGHDKNIDTISSRMAEFRAEMNRLAAQVALLTSRFEQSIAVTDARARDAEKLASKQVTSRELYITAVGVTAAIVSALAAGGVFH